MNDVEEFLKESNAIESVYDVDSLQQALYAWEYLIGEKEITPSVVLKTHKILMLHQPLHGYERGYFRRCAVYIGGRQGLRWDVIPEAIQSWCIDMNMPQATENTDDGKERYSKMIHVDYENIHPFIDGNGRTGRMFMNWWRIKNGLPILVIHEGPEQFDYYKWFK